MNAETTGTAFRTISMRIRGYDEETEELSEDLENISGDIADLTKVAGKGGVSIFTDETRKTYKSTYQILKDISAVWHDLTDKQQADLLEKLGGKRGAQSIATLLDDFSSVEKAMQTMQNAAGSSEREMDIIRDSLEFKINSLRETWVGVLTDITDRGEIGDIIDSLTKISEVIGKMIDQVGLLPAGIGLFGTLFGTQNLGLASIQNGKLAFGKEGILGTIGDVERKGNLDYLTNVHDAILNMQDLQNPVADISHELDNIADNSNEASGQVKEFVNQLVENGDTGANALGKVNDEIEKTKKSSSALGMFFKNLGANLLNIGASLAISTAVTLAISGIQKLANSYDDLMVKVNEYTQKYQDTNKQLTDYADQIASLRETMTSSSSTTEEVADATKQLYTIQNDLISTYGGYASGIDLVNGKLDTQLDILKSIDQQNLKNTINQIKSERSAKEGGLNLLQNLTEDFVGLGIIRGFNNAKSFFNGEKKFAESVGDTFVGEGAFKQSLGDDKVNNINDIRKSIEQFARELKGIKIDASTRKFIDGLKSFSYDYQSGTINISGDVQQVKKDVLTLQDLLKEAGISNEQLDKQLVNLYQKTTGIIEQNLESYNAILKNDILNGDNQDLQNYYDKLITLQEDYSQKLATGDQDAIKEASNAYVKAFLEIEEQIKNSDIDDSFIQYFRNLAPELETEIQKWNVADYINKQFENEWDLRDYIKFTDIDDLSSDYFRMLREKDNGTISSLNQNRLDKLEEWAANQNMHVLKLLESYKALNDEIGNTATNLSSLGIVPPSFETISTALSEQKENGTLTKETIETLNNTYGKLFDGFDGKAKLFQDDIKRIYKELEGRQKGGTVNLKLRPEIDTSELEKAGWGKDNGDYATVLTGTFSDQNETKFLNFTPIIVDPNTGEYKGVLTPDELTQYAEGVIAGTRTDDLNLQIGAEFTSLQEAEGAANYIHNLHEQLHDDNASLYSTLENSLYEFTENGVLLNTEALNKYNDVLAESAMAAAELKEAHAVKEYQREATSLKELIGEQGALTNAYNMGEDALRSYLATTDSLSESVITDIELSLDRLDTLSEEINKYDMLEAQIRATTSTLNKYVEATQTANEKDNFDTATSMLSSIKDAYEKGWTGTDDFKRGMEYLGGYNFDPNIMEFGKDHDSTWVTQFEEYIKRAERYFTEDISGIYNFLDDAVTKTQEDTQDFIQKSAEGIYTINIDNIDAFAQKMDMSVSSVMDLLLATDEAWDFNVDFGNIGDGIVDGLHEISKESVDARTDLEGIEEEIRALDKVGFDTTDLWAAYDEVAKEISPEVAIDNQISQTSSDSIRRWADSIVKEAEGDLSGVKIDFNADVKGLSSTITQLQEVRENAKIKGEFNEDEYRQASVVLQALLDQKHELEATTVMSIDTSSMSENMQGAVSLVQQYVSAYQELENKKTLGVDDTEIQVAEERVENLKQSLANLDGATIANLASNLGIDATKISVDADPTQLYQTLTKLDVNDKVKQSDIKVGADTSQAESKVQILKNNISSTPAYIPVDLKDGWSNNIQETLDTKTFKLKTHIDPPVTGDNDAAGGVIHASSNNLVGELGEELLCRDGRYYVIGANGAEFVPVQKGDIIFNAEQTAQLLRNGRINSRGKLMGNSFASGTKAKGRGDGYTAGSTWNKKKKKTQSTATDTNNSNTTDTTKQTKQKLDKITKQTAQEFDWIPVRIQRIEEEIERLDKIATDAFSNWSKRTKSLNKEIQVTTTELKAQEKAQKRYLERAKKVKVGNVTEKPKKSDYESGQDENGNTTYNEKQYNYDLKKFKEAERIWKTGKYQKLVQQGKIGKGDLSKFKNQFLADTIEKYQEWYQDSVDAGIAVDDLILKLKELNKQKFDNITTRFSNAMDVISKKSDLIQKKIDRTETMGYFVDESYYKKQRQLLTNNSKNKDKEGQLQKQIRERNEHIAQLNAQEALDKKKGGVNFKSEAWYEMYQQIMDDNAAIEETRNQIAELDKQIKQLAWDKFDYLREKLDDITAEAEYLQEILSSEKMMDDRGFYNNRGWANAAMITVQYKEAQKGMNEVLKERAKITDAMRKNNKDEEDRWQDLTDKARDYAKAMMAAKDAMKSFVEESINQNLSKLKELMDEYKKAMSTAKD